jgi:hypothetical protein
MTGWPKNKRVVCMKKFIVSVFVIGTYIFTNVVSLSAQTDPSPKVIVTANVDLVSRYIWRGIDIGHAPSIQPGIAVQWKEFKLGAWGAYKMTGEGGQETDFYLSKTVGFATFAIWDYFSFNDTTKFNLFDYKEKTTAHLLEAQLLLSGGKILPFNFFTSYFFYGSDLSKSLYFELQFEHKYKLADLMVFAGYQAKGNYYASRANFVNIGCTVKKMVSVTDRLALPVYFSFIVNPDNKVSYLVVGITL